LLQTLFGRTSKDYGQQYKDSFRVWTFINADYDEATKLEYYVRPAMLISELIHIIKVKMIYHPDDCCSLRYVKDYRKDRHPTIDGRCNKSLQDHGIDENSCIFLLKLRGGMANVSITGNNYLTFTNAKNESINVSSFHVSCQSDQLKNIDGNSNMYGAVLYMYDNQHDWYLNGIHCKSGYIIIKNTESLKDANHGGLYKHFFNETLRKIVGGGFAIYKGTLKFNSSNFNSCKDDGWHNEERAMSQYEKVAIQYALSNWMKGIQNTSIKDIISKCPSFVYHGDYKFKIER